MEKPYLDLTELSALFGMKKSSLLNAISSERFCCPTYKLGRQRGGSQSRGGILRRKARRRFASDYN